MNSVLDIKVDTRRAEAAAVGAEHGITPADWRGLQERVAAAHPAILEQRRSGRIGFYDLYKDGATRERVRSLAARMTVPAIENLVVLGIGGSALGISALNTALNPPYYNLLSKGRRGRRPRLFVMDNIDPDTFTGMLRLCPPEKTLYNVISKSGETAETMLQAMILLDRLEGRLGREAIRRHVVVTTSPRGGKSLLHPVADAYGLECLEIPPNVGGRFSVFTPVGLFPAAVLGMDLDAMSEGCAAMDRRCQDAALKENPAYRFAAAHYFLDRFKGKHQAVMMPYADGLRDVADWFRQLWAESLGKRYDRQGVEVYAGQTPVKALGATDQHSQVQLYREGPNDKLFTIIGVKKFGKTLKVPEVLSAIRELDYLRGKSMNQLMAAELRGTVDALKASARPVIEVSMPRINAHTVAQLLYLLEVATAMAGELYDVNAFDQPGVEEGKRIARALLGGA